MYHEQLVKRISLELSSGKSEQTIRHELQEEGWDGKDIELAFYYHTHKDEISHFSVKRLLRSEVKESTFLLTVLIGILTSLSFFFIPNEHVIRYELIADATSTPQTSILTYGAQSILSHPDFFAKVKNQLIDKKTTFIEVDLSQMIARVYKNGTIVVEVPVKTKGKDGSWWETPAGLYKIETKEKSHYSSMGHVSQPWSMQFQGNFFIHGWPKYDNGTPVSSTFSGGCVRLTDEDSKKIFDEVEVGTPILVYEKDFIPDVYTYSEITPQVIASSFMTADLLNNYIFYEKNRAGTINPGMITKFMTALVATEYINIEKEANITSRSLVDTPIKRLRVGMKISVYQLLFPLLQESSNEAAESIALLYGRGAFIKHMNTKAKAIGMTNTVFVDPTGVGSGNVSTPEDLFMLAKYIYNNRSFLFGITSGKIKTSTYGKSIFTDLSAANEFTGQPNFFGGISEETTAWGSNNFSVFTISTSGKDRPIFFLSLNSKNSKKDITNAIEYLRGKYK